LEIHTDSPAPLINDFDIGSVLVGGTTGFHGAHQSLHEDLLLGRITIEYGIAEVNVHFVDNVVGILNTIVSMVTSIQSGVGVESLELWFRHLLSWVVVNNK